MLARELTIGEVAARSGVATSALRFYEAEGLIDSTRTDGNQRRFERSGRLRWPELYGCVAWFCAERAG